MCSPFGDYRDQGEGGVVGRSLAEEVMTVLRPKRRESTSELVEGHQEVEKKVCETQEAYRILESFFTHF